MYFLEFKLSNKESILSQDCEIFSVIEQKVRLAVFRSGVLIPWSFDIAPIKAIQDLKLKFEKDLKPVDSSRIDNTNKFNVSIHFDSVAIEFELEAKNDAQIIFIKNSLKHTVVSILDQMIEENKKLSLELKASEAPVMPSI